MTKVASKTVGAEGVVSKPAKAAESKLEKHRTQVKAEIAAIEQELATLTSKGWQLSPAERERKSEVLKELTALRDDPSLASVAELAKRIDANWRNGDTGNPVRDRGIEVAQKVGTVAAYAVGARKLAGAIQRKKYESMDTSLRRLVEAWDVLKSTPAEALKAALPELSSNLKDIVEAELARRSTK